MLLSPPADDNNKTGSNLEHDEEPHRPGGPDGGG